MSRESWFSALNAGWLRVKKRGVVRLQIAKPCRYYNWLALNVWSEQQAGIRSSQQFVRNKNMCVLMLCHVSSIFCWRDWSINNCSLLVQYSEFNKLLFFYVSCHLHFLLLDEQSRGKKAVVAVINSDRNTMGCHCCLWMSSLQLWAQDHVAPQQRPVSLQ